MTAKIDWAWIKSTPPDSWGIVPGLGMTFFHRARTPVQCESCLLVDGDNALRTSRRGPKWSRVDLVPLGPVDRSDLRERCTLLRTSAR